MNGKVISFPGDLSSLPDQLIPSVRYDGGVFGELRRKRSTKKEQADHFVLGPIYFRWIRACREAHPEALGLLLVIIGHARMRGEPVPVGEACGREIGLGAASRKRALIALEATGLVRVERRPGQAPRASLASYVAGRKSG